MSEQSEFDVLHQLIQLVAKLDISSAKGKALYSSPSTLRKAPHYIVGLNPGGDKDVETITVLDHLRTERSGKWSEYIDESWYYQKAQRDAGDTPMQRRVRRLAEMLGIDLKSTFCSNIIFARDIDVKATLNNPLHQSYVKDSATIQGFLINVIRPRFILVFGQKAASLFREIEKSENFRVQTNLSSTKGNYFIVTFRHFSRGSDQEFYEKNIQAFNDATRQSMEPRKGVELEDFPVAIFQDRYGGTYSRGIWLAIACATKLENGAYRIISCLEDGPHGEDTDAAEFWSDPPHWIAAGRTPDEALTKLRAQVQSRADRDPA